MPSPAALHRQAVLARLAADKAPEGIAADRPEEGAEASEYRLLLAQLGTDLSRLREIMSVEGKIELKRSLIPAYDNHVIATVLAAHETGKALQDEIVTTMMIWRFDIGDFAGGLELAEHVLRFGLALPQNIVRKPATLIAEEIAEAALMAVKVGKPFDLDTLSRTILLTAGEDMPDQVRAKLYKAKGRLLQRIAETVNDTASAPAGAAQGALREAQTSFLRALELDRNCGVKKEIERLQSKVLPATE